MRIVVCVFLLTVNPLPLFKKTVSHPGETLLLPPVSASRGRALNPYRLQPLARQTNVCMRILISLTVLSLLWLLPQACGKTEHLQGRNLYDQHCANCHMEDGRGLRQLIPPLAGADYLRDNPAAVVRGIRRGMVGEMVVNGKVYNQPMPGNIEISEFQIVNIVNYINQAWGNDYGNVTVDDARKWLTE